VWFPPPPEEGVVADPDETCMLENWTDGAYASARR